MASLTPMRFIALLIGIAVVSAVLGGAVGMRLASLRQTPAEAAGFNYFLSGLESGTITAGSTKQYGKPAMEASYPPHSLSPQFWVCMYRQGQNRIVLYYEKGQLFAAQGLWMDTARRDVWWFCDEVKFAEYTRLATEARAKQPTGP